MKLNSNKMKKSLISFFIMFIILFCASIYPQWQQQTNGLPQAGLGWAIDACSNTIAIIAVDSTLYETIDAGIKWTKTSYSFPEAVDVTIIDKNHFWACTGNGQIIATSDGGTIWTLQFYDTTKTKFMNYIKMFDLNNGIAMGDAFNSSSPAFF